MIEGEFFLGVCWLAGEETEEYLLEEFFGGEVLEGELSELMIIAEAGEPGPDGAVGNDGGLEGGGVGAALVDGAMANRVPTEGAQDIGNGLDSWESEAEAVTFVGETGEHPGATRLSKIEAAGDRAFAVDVDVHLFGVERFSGGVEE